MRKILFSLLTLILLTNCTIAQKNETIIKGKIQGKIPKEIIYTTLLNGTFSRNFNHKIKPNKNGEFDIKISLETPSFIEILIANKIAKSFVVENGKNYDLILDFDAKDKNEQFKLYRNKERLLYQDFPLAGSARQASVAIGINKSISEIKREISIQKNKKLKPFDLLLADKKINNELYHFIKMNTDIYFSAVAASVITTKFMRTNPKDFDKFPKETKQYWSTIFDENSILETSFITSPFWVEYAKLYNDFKEYTAANFGIEKIMKMRELVKQGKIHSYFIEKASYNLPEFSLEFYTANYLLEELNKKRFEKELLSLFASFKEKYPSSIYLEYLTSEIHQLKKFHKIKDEKETKKISFIKNYQNKNTLKEILKSFKGQRVYLDIWATWCGPCKEEFKHKKELDSFLKANNIKLLYISIDDENRNEQWKKMTEYYNLYGSHLRANKKLIKELQILFNNNGTIEIPWYLLINENGTIAKRKAKRPSQLIELKEEINKVFKS